MSNEPNRVWIELMPPRGDDHAKEVCEKANRLLKKLGATGRHFGYIAGKGYIMNNDDGSGYMELIDRGEWFNLDYLAE